MYNKIKRNRSEREKLVESCPKLESSYQELSKKVDEVGIKIVKETDEIGNSKVKSTLLRLKLKDLQNKLNDGKTRYKDINDAFPSKCENEEPSIEVIIASKTLEEGISEIEKFTARSPIETNTQEAQTEIWNKMRQLLSTTSRFSLWKAFIKEQESVINEITKFSEQNEGCPISQKNSTNDSLDYAITYLNGKEATSRLNANVVLKSKIERLSEQNDKALDVLTNLIDDRFGNRLSDAEKQQYLFAIARKFIREAEIEFLTERTECVKRHHFKLQDQVNYEGVKVLNEATRDLYSDIESNIQDLQSEISKIHKLDQKTDHEKKINEDFVKCHFKLNKTLLSNVTVVSKINTPHSIQYVKEIELFTELPMIKIRNNIPVFAR